MRTVPVQQMLQGSSVKVYEVDGTLVPTADAIARLKEPTPVLQSADGKLIDPAYRAMLNKKVLDPGPRVGTAAASATAPTGRQAAPTLISGNPE